MQTYTHTLFQIELMDAQKVYGIVIVSEFEKMKMNFNK